MGPVMPNRTKRPPKVAAVQGIVQGPSLLNLLTNLVPFISPVHSCSPSGPRSTKWASWCRTTPRRRWATEILGGPRPSSNRCSKRCHLNSAFTLTGPDPLLISSKIAAGAHGPLPSPFILRPVCFCRAEGVTANQLQNVDPPVFQRSETSTPFRLIRDRIELASLAGSPFCSAGCHVLLWVYVLPCPAVVQVPSRAVHGL